MGNSPLRFDPIFISEVQIARQYSQTAFANDVLYYYGIRKPQLFNVYLYVLNNPIIYIDSFGLWFIDIGYSGSAGTGLGPGISAGFQISSSGFNFNYGFGLGIGAGISATFNPFGEPCEGVSIAGTVRAGTGKFGAQAGLSYGSEGSSLTWGAGWGLGIGAAITASHTVKLFTW